MKFREHIIAMEAEIDRIKAKKAMSPEDAARIRALTVQILKAKTWLAGIGGIND